MAKGGGGGSEIWDIVALALVAFVGWQVIQSGALTNLLSGIKLPQLGGPGSAISGGLAPAAGGGATGTCTGGPYRGTGKTVSTKTEGPKTRHYASGKDDDTTIEKNAKGINFENYQFVNYVTIKKTDHDDNVSTKVGGRHMKGGWWDHGVSYEDGQTCLGSEKKHPSTNSCVVKGGKIGSIIGKKVGIAATVFRSTGKTEIWTDSGGGWKKGAEGSNVDGFKPLEGEHEAQLRIDGAPGVEIHCSNVQEIGGAQAALARTTRDFYARAYNTSAYYSPPPYQYRSRYVREDDCGDIY